MGVKRWISVTLTTLKTVNQLNMKVLLSITLLVALTLAEPPSYRQQSQRERNTYYIAKQQEAESPEADAPYQPSGWKPDGPAFELPQKQQQQQPAAPQEQYGAPAKPQNQYGAPVKSPQRQYGSQAAPQRQYGASATPQRQYGAPTTPQQQYGAPPTPRQQYGAPTTPQQQYGPPQPTTIEPPTVTDYEESTILPTATESQAEPVDSVNELDEVGDVDEQQRQSGEYYIALPDGRLQRVQYISSQDIEAMKYFAKIRAENVEPLRGPIYNYQPLQKLQFTPTQLQVALEEPIVTAPIVPVRENNLRSQKIQTSSAPAKLERQPLAAPVGAAPLSSSFATYTANYQIPAAAPATEQRFLVTF